MKREAKIGIFAVVILICSWAGIRFLSGMDVFSRNKVYYACYDQVNGVQTATPVMIRGVKVGQVSDIVLDPERENGVRLSLSIHRKYDIPKDSRAMIYSNGFLGNKAIELVLGTSSEMLDGGGEIKAEHDRDLMAMAGSEFEDIKSKLNDLSERLARTLDNVNDLLETNRNSFNGIMTHLDSVTGSMDEVVTGRKRELREIVDNLSAFSAALGRSSSKIDSTLVNVNIVAEQFADADVAGSLKTTLAKLDAVLEKFDSGDGTVAKLINDKELYTNLTAASANLSSLLADLEANPKRYVHFSVFGRGAKAAERDRAKAAEKASDVQDKGANTRK